MTGADIINALPDSGIRLISEKSGWSIPIVKKVINAYPECTGNTAQMNEIIGAALDTIKEHRDKIKANEQQAENNLKTLAQLLNQPSGPDAHLAH